MLFKGSLLQAAQRSLRSVAKQNKTADIRSFTTAGISTINGSAVAFRSTPPSTSNHELSSPFDAARCMQVRTFSNVPQGLRAFPQYTVFGETCMLTLKVMMPGFRVLKSNTLVLDGNKRGRIVLEWTPRDSEGRPVRDSQIRFALSAEECGLMLDQLPKQQEVEFVRRTQQYGGGFHDDGSGPSPDKVLRMTPGQGGMISLKVDFEKDGIGGQEAGGSQQGSVVGPLEVIVQTGEYQVIHSLIQSSLPHLVGWTTMMELALSRSISDTFQQQGGGGGGPHFSASGPSDGYTPF